MKVFPRPPEPAPRRIDDIRDDPSRFPREVLQGATTGLCMFAAEWHGRQDAYWLAEAGIQTVCVDLNTTKLDEMRRVYPPDWEFVTSDAFDFHDGKFDIVTLDPFTGTAMDQAHRLMDRWCGMANQAVIMGSTSAQKVAWVPRGWKVTDLVHRSDFAGGVFWTVVRPT